MREVKTHLLLLLVAAVWGSTWTVGRFLSYGLDDARANMGPATSAWLRYVFAVAGFLAWCWIYRNMDGPRLLPRGEKAWKYTFWMALLGTMGYQILFMNGMKWTAAGDASMIIPMNPVFTVLLAAPLLGQRLSPRMVLGLLIGLIGVAIVIGWSPNTEIPFKHRLLGAVMICLAALMWAATSNLTKMALIDGTIGTSLEIVVWYSIIALPLTLILPAFANVVAASVPANAVKPIFFKFVIFSPLLFIVITNSIFLENYAYFTKVNDY